MLALVEPCIMDDLLDRPHLGCAMLIAACQERGIRTTLIKGQTRYLKDIFVNDSQELWGLIQDLKKDDLKKMGIAEYKRTVQEKGIRQFQAELKSLYQDVIVDKHPRRYFNGQLLEKFYNLYNLFVAIYRYYFRKLNHQRLKIVDNYLSEIIKTSPRYIGFSLHGSFEPLSRIIRKRIKELTGIPIIIGGALTPFIDLKKLEKKTFEDEYFDYLVVGAGEQALPSLIERLENKKEPKGIANVFYKKDSRIKGNDLEVINDLDSLPYPDYSQFDLDLYLTLKRILPLQAARGCSWRRCAFCSFHKKNLGKYRVFSIKRIIETLQYLNRRYCCQFFTFHQDDLTSSQARRISQAILSNNLRNINIFSAVRPANGYNSSALLLLMRKAGFVQLHWGIESGNQRVLNLMNKGTDIKTISQILRKSSKNKIGNICFIFFGFPGETKEEAQQTVEFLKKHAVYIDDISFGQFVLEKYSPVGQSPERWGLELKDDSHYSTKGGMSPREVDIFCSKFYKEFMRYNPIKFASGKLNCLSQGHYRVMAHFLMSGHNILSNPILLEWLKSGRLNSIFPIILGEIKRKGNRIALYPINIKESTFINQYHPEKERVLDGLEEKIFVLTDGRLSIEDIILVIDRDFKRGHRKKYIRKKCTVFFKEVFSKNWGLGFKKSWQWS